MTTLQTAKILREAGFSVIPVKADKRPLISWKEYQTRTPTEEELTKWFSRDAGIALCAGKIQCLDFDEKYSRGIFPRFAARAEEVGLDFVLGELIRQKTPSGGYHLVWRCDTGTIGNEKLASRPATEEERKAGNREFSMIETRGDGGYFLISPSPGYRLESGDWSSIPVISEEDRDALLSLARSFDERPPVEVASMAQMAQDDFPADPARAPELTPGDDYDSRADIPALLRRHGWKSSGDKYWTRPGKAKGISATWGVVPDRFYVFSSSTQFQSGHVYRPWHIYAVLECDGDFARAAGELRRQGFGGLAKKKNTVSEALAKFMPAVEAYSEPPGVEGTGVDPHGVAPTNETEDDKIRRLLRARAFDPDKVPPPIRPVFTLGGVVICTPGNLTAITAQAKVGKSALVSALTAATMTPEGAEADLLTAEGPNTQGKALLYVDTEQAPDDFWHAINRAKRRAKVERVPEWLQAYTIADLPAQIGRKAIAIAMADLAEQFGGIHSVIIDGVADLVLDVNDAQECNALVAELHEKAIRYDCVIICVIHKNPGSEKVRGHLGSQIERKAETNLNLEKDDQVTVVWSNKQRRAPIDKATGPRFHWDDDLKMHVTTANAGDRPSAKLVQMVEVAEAVIKPGQSIPWKDLVTAIQDVRSTPEKRFSQRTAETWVSEMKKQGVVVVKMGHYSLNPAHQLGAAA